MKTYFALLIALLASLVGHTQDTIPLYSDGIARQKSQLRPSIGLDLFQAVWFLDSPNPTALPTRFTHPVSITLYIPDKRLNHAGRARYINVGYVAYGGTLQRNIYQKGSSVHLRMGIEHTRRTLIYGYGGLIAGWKGQASFLFTGTTFGDYMQSIGTRSGLPLVAKDIWAYLFRSVADFRCEQRYGRRCWEKWATAITYGPLTSRVLTGKAKNRLVWVLAYRPIWFFGCKDSIG